MIDITVVILTFNEEKHIRRSVESVKHFAKRIVVLDSFSNDNTESICQSLGVDFFQNEWKNYATQFNYALDNTDINTEWIMRLDADEYLDRVLISDIESNVIKSQSHDGFLVNRVMSFMGKTLRFGGMSNYYMLRIWRAGLGRCEQRWMDEHIILESNNLAKLKGKLVDDNKNSIHWWIDKHNNYSAREAVDSIFGDRLGKSKIGNTGTTNVIRRKLKMLYLYMPSGLRAFLYFIYRYIVLLGFLDGRRGFIWCFMQGWWYRSVVDLKIEEIQRYKERRAESTNAVEFIKDNYGLNVSEKRD